MFVAMVCWHMYIQDQRDRGESIHKIDVEVVEVFRQCVHLQIRILPDTSAKI